MVDMRTFLPALSLLPGLTPDQEARLAAVGNTSMFTPISAINSLAPVLPIPGNRTKTLNLCLNWHAASVNLCIQNGYLLLKTWYAATDCFQHELMVFSKATFNCIMDLLLCTLYSSVSTQWCEVIRICTTGQYLIYQPCTGNPVHITENTWKFQVGILKHLQYPVLLGCHLLHLLTAITRQVTQITLSPVRMKLPWEDRT